MVDPKGGAGAEDLKDVLSRESREETLERKIGEVMERLRAIFEIEDQDELLASLDSSATNLRMFLRDGDLPQGIELGALLRGVDPDWILTGEGESRLLMEDSQIPEINFWCTQNCWEIFEQVKVNLNLGDEETAEILGIKKWDERILKKRKSSPEEWFIHAWREYGYNSWFLLHGAGEEKLLRKENEEKIEETLTIHELEMGDKMFEPEMSELALTAEEMMAGDVLFDVKLDKVADEESTLDDGLELVVTNPKEVLKKMRDMMGFTNNFTLSRWLGADYEQLKSAQEGEGFLPISVVNKFLEKADASMSDLGVELGEVAATERKPAPVDKKPEFVPRQPMARKAPRKPTPKPFSSIAQKPAVAPAGQKVKKEDKIPEGMTPEQWVARREAIQAAATGFYNAKKEARRGSLLGELKEVFGEEFEEEEETRWEMGVETREGRKAERVSPDEQDDYESDREIVDQETLQHWAAMTEVILSPKNKGMVLISPEPLLTYLWRTYPGKAKDAPSVSWAVVRNSSPKIAEVIKRDFPQLMARIADAQEKTQKWAEIRKQVKAQVEKISPEFPDLGKTNANTIVAANTAEILSKLIIPRIIQKYGEWINVFMPLLLSRLFNFRESLGAEEIIENKRYLKVDRLKMALRILEIDMPEEDIEAKAMKELRDQGDGELPQNRGSRGYWSHEMIARVCRAGECVEDEKEKVSGNVKAALLEHQRGEMDTRDPGQKFDEKLRNKIQRIIKATTFLREPIASSREEVDQLLRGVNSKRNPDKMDFSYRANVIMAARRKKMTEGDGVVPVAPPGQAPIDINPSWKTEGKSVATDEDARVI